MPAFIQRVGQPAAAGAAGVVLRAFAEHLQAHRAAVGGGQEVGCLLIMTAGADGGVGGEVVEGGGIFGMISKVVDWVKGLFDFSSFEAGLWSAVKIIFLPITILVSMISSVFDWLKELFGFGEKEKAKANVGGTSIFGIMKDALSGVWEWFKSLFDIDFTKIISGLIPEGKMGDFARKALGLPVKGKSVAELQTEVKAMEDVVGMGNSTSGQREKLDDLRKELETLKRQNQATAAGGSVNVKADTNIHNERTAISTAVLTKPNPMIAEIAGSPF